MYSSAHRGRSLSIAAAATSVVNSNKSEIPHRYISKAFANSLDPALLARAAFCSPEPLVMLPLQINVVTLFSCMYLAFASGGLTSSGSRSNQNIEIASPNTLATHNFHRPWYTSDIDSKDLPLIKSRTHIFSRGVHPDSQHHLAPRTNDRPAHVLQPDDITAARDKFRNLAKLHRNMYTKQKAILDDAEKQYSQTKNQKLERFNTMAEEVAALKTSQVKTQNSIRDQWENNIEKLREQGRRDPAVRLRWDALSYHREWDRHFNLLKNVADHNRRKAAMIAGLTLRKRLFPRLEVGRSSSNSVIGV